MRRILSLFCLFSFCLITNYSYVVCKTNKKICKKQTNLSESVPSKPKCTAEEYARYLGKKGVKGFKEAIKILKTSIPPQGTNLEKQIAAIKIHDSAALALENYQNQQNSNLNKYGINDKALSTLIGIATADKLAPFYIGGKFTLKDLDAVDHYITSGGKDENRIQRLLNMA